MNRYVVFVLALGFAVGVDQASKAWLTGWLAPGEQLEVIPGFFYLTHLQNPGAVFGLFADLPQTVRLAGFIGVFAIACALVAVMFRSLAPGDLRASAALGAVIGGALGNVLDRVLREGAVVDFLQLRPWDAPSWPDFNLADTFIVMGIASMLIDLLAVEHKDASSLATDEPKN